MPLFSHVPSERQAVVVDGVTFYKTDWMNNGKDPDFSPTVFLVEQPPESSLRTHFHQENQFQLFVRGSGVIGPHQLQALTVHYAGAYSGYGPLLAGEEGIAYFTLRTVFETGSMTMAQHGDRMKRGPKRQLHSQPVPIVTAGQLATLVTPATLALIPLQPDHAAAHMYSLPAGRTYTGLDPAGSAGQFYVVLAGCLLIGACSLQNGASVFISPDEAPLAIVAGSEGLQLVCVQFPHKAAEYR